MKLNVSFLLLLIVTLILIVICLVKHYYSVRIDHYHLNKINPDKVYIFENQESLATITPIPPTLQNCCMDGYFGQIDFRTWSVEDLWPIEVQGAPGTQGIWTVTNNGTNVTQTGTYFTQVSVFYSPFDFGHCQSCEIPVRAIGSPQAGDDDDFIGFVLGWQPNHSQNSNAEYILIDWRRATAFFDFGAFDPIGGAESACTSGGDALIGLAVSRVFGTPTRDELWQHQSFDNAPCLTEPSGVIELARGLTLGSTGWIQDQIYLFRIEYGKTRLRIWVDDILEFDLTPQTGTTFPEGRLGLYNFSQTSEYGITLSDTRNNLVFNPDFSLGNTGFTSDYTFAISQAAGTYAVVSNPLSQNFYFSQCPDHTTGTGNMMVINGANIPNVIVWSQNISSILPNRKYLFSTWITRVYSISPARLQFRINGQTLGDIFQVSSSLCTWSRFSEIWDSGNDTSATISIINQNTVSAGNDFALDDIYFSLLENTTSARIFPELCCNSLENLIEGDAPVDPNSLTITRLEEFNGTFVEAFCPDIENIPDLQWISSTNSLPIIDSEGLVTLISDTQTQKIFRAGVTISDINGLTSNESILYFGFNEITSLI